MRIHKILILFLVIVAAGGLFAYSTWYQWSSNQTTILERMRPIPPNAEFNHGTRIKSIAFSPNNSDLIVSAGESNKVYVWNINNVESPEFELTSNTNAQKVIDDINYIAFSQQDDRLISISTNELTIWDVSTWETINTNIKLSTTAEAISPVKQILATANTNLILWDIRNSTDIKGDVLLPVRKDKQAISLDGISMSDTDKIYEVKQFVSTLLNSFQMIDFSHDGKWIATSGKVYDNTRGGEGWVNNVKVWDLQSKKLFKIMENKTTDNLDHENDGTRSVKVPMVDGMRTIKTKNQLEVRDYIRTIKFSPDNRFFSVARGNRITIWSLPDWNIYHEIFDQICYDVAFSPNGDVFAVAGLGGVTLWSIESLTPISILIGTEFVSSVSVVEFSHDGSVIAGGGSSGLLWLWDVSDINEH